MPPSLRRSIWVDGDSHPVATHRMGGLMASRDKAVSRVLKGVTKPVGSPASQPTGRWYALVGTEGGGGGFASRRQESRHSWRPFAHVANTPLSRADEFWCGDPIGSIDGSGRDCLPLERRCGKILDFWQPEYAENVHLVLGPFPGGKKTLRGCTNVDDCVEPPGHGGGPHRTPRGSWWSPGGEHRGCRRAPGGPTPRT